MYSLKQNNFETLEEYIEKLEEMAYVLNITTEQKLDTLINGLNNRLKPSAIMKQFIDYEDAVEYLIKDSVSTTYNINLVQEMINKIDLKNRNTQFSNRSKKNYK